MVRLSAAFIAALSVALVSPAAHAGAYADDMGKCLVKAATDDDRTVFMRWSFAMMALNPAVKSWAVITPQARADVDRALADSFQRLVYVDCRGETIAALKHEGTKAFTAGLRAVGESAFQGLSNDPAVSAGLRDLVKYVDSQKLAELMAEAQSTPDTTMDNTLGK
jgi:hypothetical protein